MAVQAIDAGPRLRILLLKTSDNRRHDATATTCGLGASEVFDYHAGDWVQHVRDVVPEGVDILLDAFGGQTGDQAVGAVRDGGRAIFLVGAPTKLGRGVVGESLDADVNRQRLDAIGRLVEAGSLRLQVEAVLPFAQVREALERVAGRHTRGKVVLQIG